MKYIELDRRKVNSLKIYTADDGEQLWMVLFDWANGERFLPLTLASNLNKESFTQFPAHTVIFRGSENICYSVELIGELWTMNVELNPPMRLENLFYG